MSMNHATDTLPASSTVPGSLRLALRADAVASGVSGVGLASAGSAVDGLTGLPAALSHGAGVFLLLWAVGLAVLASREVIPRAAVWTVVIVNAVWALDSVAILVAGVFPVTVWGVALVLGIAVAVLLFAAWQLQGLRRLH